MVMFRHFSHLVLLAGLTLLTGCADWESHMQDSLPTPKAAYADKQIVVSPTRSVFAAVYKEGQTVLPEAQQAYLMGFLDRTVHDKARTVMVEQPARRHDRLGYQRSTALAGWLERNGYHVVPFADAAPVSGQIQLAVDHLIAQAPNCPNWDFHPNYAFSSEQLPNQGCADRGNLAAMIANPQDLIEGQVPSAPMGHGALRGEVNYRNGEIAPLQDAGDIVGN